MNSKDYEINQWSDWLNELALSVRDFYNTFHKLPNILEASEYTFSQFEFMTEISPIGQEIKNVDTEKVGNETEKVHIRELTFKDECTLTFIVNDNFSDKKYRLKLELLAKKAKAQQVKIKKRVVTAPTSNAGRQQSICKSGRQLIIFALQMPRNSYLC